MRYKRPKKPYHVTEMKTIQTRIVTNYKSHTYRVICRLQLKSVQTTAEVCTDYTCSLHRLRRVLNLSMRKYKFKCVHSLMKTFAYTNFLKSNVLLFSNDYLIL